jgi:hypothetical protein
MSNLTRVADTVAEFNLTLRRNGIAFINDIDAVNNFRVFVNGI